MGRTSLKRGTSEVRSKVWDSAHAREARFIGGFPLEVGEYNSGKTGECF